MTAMGVGSLGGLSGLQLAGFRARLMADGRGVATHGQSLAALRSFLRWCGVLDAHRIPGEVIASVLRLPRMKIERPYEAVGERDICRLMRAAGSSRNRALISVMVGCGLRVAEVSALDCGDFIRHGDRRRSVYVRQGKGRRDRTVPVGAGVWRLVRAYLAETDRTDRSKGAVFLADDHGAGSRASRRISARSIGIMLNGVARRAGLGNRRLTPHTLRHSFATRTLEQGGNIVVVSRLLGHASIATTQRYCDHSIETRGPNSRMKLDLPGDAAVKRPWIAR